MQYGRQLRTLFYHELFSMPIIKPGNERAIGFYPRWHKIVCWQRAEY
jgi:hypothetical protein